ncbi:MAG: hypothetical protein IJS07_03790 [Bacteroidales bacterium]|nr:hypothetical protein [Bacteroidales bacterium]
MSTRLQGASLRKIGSDDRVSLYRLQSSSFINRYYVISSEGSSRLMAYPEVVGYDCYEATVPSTVAGMKYIFPNGGNVDILTILRGGLNYPVEEACFRCGIKVRDIHFLSCERVIENHVIKGLKIKYDKLRVSPDQILVIGDILATGDTIRLCLDEVVERFRTYGGSIRRIVFFTIGGTRAIDLMEQKTLELRELFPGFEGFDCLFYEGVFTVYEDKGATGINVPDIDFGWKGGAVCPEFRRYIMDHPYALLEKCIIYDGGARRYEIPVHFDEALEYWEGVLERAELIDPVRLVGEKLGYYESVSYEDWLELTHFQNLEDESLRHLWADEIRFLESAGTLNLAEIARKRISDIKAILKLYE